MRRTVSPAEALRVLGEAYRRNWADFDGRTLRSELGMIASKAENNEFICPEDDLGVCSQCSAWLVDCDCKKEEEYEKGVCCGAMAGDQVIPCDCEDCAGEEER